MTIHNSETLAKYEQVLDSLYSSHTAATAAGDWGRVEYVNRMVDQTLKAMCPAYPRPNPPGVSFPLRTPNVKPQHDRPR